VSLEWPPPPPISKLKGLRTFFPFFPLLGGERLVINFLYYRTKSSVPFPSVLNYRVLLVLSLVKGERRFLDWVFPPLSFFLQIEIALISPWPPISSLQKMDRCCCKGFFYADYWAALSQEEAYSSLLPRRPIRTGQSRSSKYWCTVFPPLLTRKWAPGACGFSLSPPFFLVRFED